MPWDNSSAGSALSYYLRPVWLCRTSAMPGVTGPGVCMVCQDEDRGAHFKPEQGGPWHLGAFQSRVSAVFVEVFSTQGGPWAPGQATQGKSPSASS